VASYQVDFSNLGQSAIGNGQIAMAVPRGMQYVSSDPAGNQFGDEIRWSLGSVPPQVRGTLRVDFRVTSPGQNDVCARASADGVAAGDDCVFTQASDTATPTPAVQNRLAVRISGPETARVGERVRYTITATNLSNETLPRVLLRDDFDSGLGHVQGASPIEWATSLGPNESRDLPLNFTVLIPGQHCHNVTVTSGDGSRATARACLNGVAAGAGGATSAPSGGAPVGGDPFGVGSNDGTDSGVSVADSIEVDVRAPAAIRVGEPAFIEIRLRNTSSAVLTGLQVTDEFNPALYPDKATDGYDMDQVASNRLVWNLPSLNPGAETVLTVQARGRGPSNSACHSVTVRSPSGINKGDVACVRIDGGVSLNLTPASTSLRLPTGGLRLTVSDLGDPARVNERITYVVMIHNDRDVSDQEVVLTITLPEGSQFETSINPPMIRARNSTPDRRTVEFLPVAELRAGESATYRIVATSATTGPGLFRAQVTSARASVPVVVTEETTFFVE
jgi:uncharacterized repeat protein (TIGR01451 family)